MLPSYKPGVKLGDLARYLMVSRQNLAAVLDRLEEEGRDLVAFSEQLVVRIDERAGPPPALGSTLYLAPQDGCLHTFDEATGHRL